MTDLLEQAVETARALPDEMQDEIARMVLQLTGAADQPVIQLTPDEEASFAVSLEQARTHNFASDEQVQAVWSKHGL